MDYTELLVDSAQHMRPLEYDLSESHNELVRQVERLQNEVDAISYNPTRNLIEISEDTFLKSTDDSVNITYGENVDITFTNTANPLLFWAINGLEAGKSYTLTFDVLSGSIQTISQQAVVVWNYSTNWWYSKIATATKDGSTYTINFTPTDTRLAFQLTLVYSSKTVTLGNFMLVEDALPQKLVLNSAIVDLPETSLDDALRAKINANSVAVLATEYDTDENLFVADRLTGGQYINGSNGVATATGSAYSVTDYIPLEAGIPYYWHNIINGYWAFYSSQSAEGYINGLNYQSGNTDGYFVTPENTSYGRFTVRNADTASAWISVNGAEPTGDTLYALNANVSTHGEHPSNPCAYSGSEISIFHKGLCIGDSLTQGVCNYNEGGTSVANVSFPNYSYPTYLAKLTGCEITNKGSAGVTTSQWYTAHAADDLSGYDFAIIQLGINDAISDHGWSAEQETAINNIIGKLKTENNNIKIFVATIVPAISYRGEYYDAVSEGIRTYVESLADNNVILLDIAAHGHTAEELAYNAGHLSAYGYMTLAKDYVAYIGWHIVNHKMDFRQVQFIGTTHSFN